MAPLFWPTLYVCMCICLCLSADIKASDAKSSRNFHVACGRGSVLLWRRCDPLCTSGLRMTSCFHIMPDSDKDTNHLSMRRPGEEDHALPGWTTSRRGRDSPWKSQSEWQRTDKNGQSTSMLWPTLGSTTAKEQNRTIALFSNGEIAHKERRRTVEVRKDVGVERS